MAGPHPPLYPRAQARARAFTLGHREEKGETDRQRIRISRTRTMARRLASSALTRGLLPAAPRAATPAAGALAAGAQRMGSLLQARLAAQRRAGSGGARGPAGAGASSAEPAVAEAELDVEAPVCIVTGGSRGIGRSCALALGSVGAKVVVNYASSEAKAQEVADLIEE